MIGKRSTRAVAAAIAIVILVLGATTAMAVTTTLSAKGTSVVKIARENSTTATATANSTTYVDIPGASVTIKAPSTTNGSVLMARFQGHFSLVQTSGCIARLIVNNVTVMEPSGNYNIVGQYSVSELIATSGSIERSLAVPAGTYTVKAQLRLTAVSSASSACAVSAWHLLVERMNV